MQKKRELKKHPNNLECINSDMVKGNYVSETMFSKKVIMDFFVRLFDCFEKKFVEADVLLKNSLKKSEKLAKKWIWTLKIIASKKKLL